jgi:hypothetical protein
MRISTLAFAALGTLGALGAGYAGWSTRQHAEGSVARATAVEPSASGAQATATFETRHYTITTTATPLQTARVAEAVESLHGAYSTFFRDLPAIGHDRSKLKLVLYRDQQEFKAHNRSRPWAEAYYQTPICYAYYADGRPNPYHWMVHEATHQLNREVAGFRRIQWIDEGLASYFGSSRIERGALRPGSIDVDTYPIWWLTSLALSGDVEEDIRKGRIISLRALISGTGPDIGHHVNLYYIEFWSLSHFLFHYQGGQYARQYRQLIATGGSLEDFEAVIGPVDRIQAQWYSYLREKITEISAPVRAAMPPAPEP